MVIVGGASMATAQAYGQNTGLSAPKTGDISPEKMQALLAASAELDAFFEAHHRRLERARPEDMTYLQELLTTEPKAILERHNLTRDDLTQWRQRLETYGDIPVDDLEDPHYHHVVKRLMPRQR